MKNFIFISPNFPKTYYQFTEALKEEGFNVLGIADQDYAVLDDKLKQSFTEYYKVNNMQDYDEMFKAVAYFSYKYGHIDFIESNNEFWLHQDARLREDFNVTTGKNSRTIKTFQSKELEKKYYSKAGIKTARYIIPKYLKDAEKFVKLVGYPLIAKPDVGVGAQKTFRISNEDELKNFFKNLPKVKYIIEEYVEGSLISFDGISDSKGKAVFYSNEVFPNPIMDVVNGKSDVWYYSNISCPTDLIDAGARVLKAFKAYYRYFHLEFFRLTSSKKGLGKNGDLIGLETNMRAPGGYTPDIIDYSKSVSTYKIWAEVMAHDKTDVDMNNKKYYAVYVGRRNGKTYALSSIEVLKKYQKFIVMHDIMPSIIADAMGDESFVGRFETYEEVSQFVQDLQEIKQKNYSIS